MPNTTTAPPWPRPRRGHPDLRRAFAIGQAAAVRGGGGDPPVLTGQLLVDAVGEQRAGSEDGKPRNRSGY
jgi:hypothetical protein